MHGRRAALAAAVLLSTGAGAAVASAAGPPPGAPPGPPPPPTAVNGAPVQQVAAGLQTPTSFAFGGGHVFEGDGGSESASGPPNGGVYLLKGGQAIKLHGSPQFVGGLTFHKGTLYVSAGKLSNGKPKWQILAWSHFTGTGFAKRRVVYTGPKKFDGFNGLAFHHGRLYAGVDVGLTNGNDHGPAKTPYLYDVLSLKPNGTGLKVFATGMRQPWQMVFPADSSAPLVSDLGQDKGAKNPPDFVLRVRRGQDYGFPQCNRMSAKKCKGFAKPFKTFGPHMDIMGLAIIGKKLYMTSFLGANGKGPGGAVYSMPLKGGKVKPVLTGFVAPVVGLGSHAGRLYVGELTGQVFRVKP